jgi:hypothetical protein
MRCQSQEAYELSAFAAPPVSQPLRSARRSIIDDSTPSPGDLNVMCDDDAVGVYREAMAAAGASRGERVFADSGELEAPER